MHKLRTDLALGWHRLQVYAQPVKGSRNHLATPLLQVCLAPIEQGAWRPCRWMEKYGSSGATNMGLLLNKSALPIRPKSTTDWEQMRRRSGNKSSNDLWTNPDVNNGSVCCAGKQEELARVVGATNLCWNIETLKAHALQWDLHSIETKEARCTQYEGGFKIYMASKWDGNWEISKCLPKIAETKVGHWEANSAILREPKLTELAI